MDSEKIKQYKNVIGVVVLLLIVVLFFVLFNSRSSGDTKGNFYIKPVKNGVDILSDKDLWIEKSSNEISELKQTNEALKDQNKLLQKRLDVVQNILVEFGKKLNIFKGSNLTEEAKKLINSEEKQNDTLNDYQKYDDTDVNNFNNPLPQLEEFSKQKGLVSEGKVDNKDKQEGTAYLEDDYHMNPKILKSKIRVFDIKKAPEENFIFAGTYARAVLLGSVTVSASVKASSNPKPVLLRISDFGNLPNHMRGFLKNAVVIGAAYGNLSSESVVIRLERIVKIDNKRGIGVDIPVKGYVAGENGDAEIRGKVFDRSGAVVRNAAVAGLFSGIGNYMASNKNNITFDPGSGLAQVSQLDGSKMVKAGASEGLSAAANKYADFIIKRAEQLQPVIKLDGGRKLTIVFTESVKASAVNMRKVRENLYEKKQY